VPRLVPDPSPDARIAAGKQRILARIIQHAEGCWEWPGGTVMNGYGALNVRLGGKDDPKVMLLVHRVAYEHYVGPIPEGLEIDHLCRNNNCCRPDHLEPVTHAENMLRGNWKGDDVPCPRGHVGRFSRTKNTQGRKCLECKRERKRHLSSPPMTRL
jgi:hypothetical protein